jgi:hypothetical protein
MTGIIKFGNTCACASPCAGDVCWRPQQAELSARIDAWQLRNPSPVYHVSSDTARHHDHALTWDPRHGPIWELLAAPDQDWQQAYAVGEERILVSQICADGTEESFAVEPTARSVPDHALVPQALVAA